VSDVKEWKDYCPSCGKIQAPQSIDAIAIKNGGVCQMCQFIKNCSDDSADIDGIEDTAPMKQIELGRGWFNESGYECEVTRITSTVIEYQYTGGPGFMALPISDFLKTFSKRSTADQILKDAIAIMVERGKSYDKNGNDKERSMPQIVAAFEAVTGIKLTPEQGNKFMVIVKLVRSEQGEDKPDNYIDGAAYMALAGEAAMESVTHG